MTLKQYLNLMLICTLICWGVWVLSIFLINPEKAGLLGFVLFYFSLFLAIVGTTAILGFLTRVRLGKTPIFTQVSVAFRQGVWLAAIVVVFFLFKGLQILRWWNFFLFILLVVIVEVLILTNRQRLKKLD